MNCTKCGKTTGETPGEVCGCPMEPSPEALAAPESAAEAVAAMNCAPEAEAQSSPEDDAAWRNELSARLQRYRTRRKAPPPRYPSLRLPFEAADSSAQPADNAAPVFPVILNHALALDGPETLPETAEPEPAQQAPPRAKRAPARIIEFPRFAWGPPPPPLDQLAGPVGNQPRILDVPETAPPPPALGGIIIEPAQRKEKEKQRGVDLPLQNALLGRRIAAALIDWLIIGVASALFGFIFWKVAAVRPPRMQILGLAAGIPCLFWAAYQYLLIVYSAATPGLRLAQLSLTRFDDSSTTRSLRRWRVLASLLSALSLGMGYAWVFLDEDALCWHDRITRTYLSPKKSA
jgi:hypothetical protein